MKKLIKVLLLFALFPLTAFGSEPQPEAPVFVVCFLGGFKSTSGEDVWAKTLPTGDAASAMAADSRIAGRDTKIYYDIEINTTEQDIIAQAADLKTKLDAKLLTDNVAIDREVNLVLIAHSQGGLRSWSFNQQFGKQTGSRYDVIGIFTAGTPWQGATIVESNPFVSLYLNDLTASVNELTQTFTSGWFSVFKKQMENVNIESVIGGVVDTIFGLSIVNAGSEPMIPGSAFLNEINAEHADHGITPEAGTTKYGFVVGTETNLFNSWLKDHEKKINLTSSVFSGITGVLINMTLNPEESIRAKAQLAHVMAMSSPEGFNALVDTAIQEHPHDCLISSKKQQAKADMLKSIPGITGAWVEDTQEASTYKVPCAHGVVTKYDHTSSETKNPDVRYKLIEWTNKVQEENE